MSESARILVVDDELPVCKSVSSALASEGHTIDMALSAEEALSKQDESGYDVIITDLMMPGLSGMDLLRTLSDKAADTKVIMITGYPSIKSAVEAVKLGAFDYIPKPFTPTELRSLVSRALESKRYHEKQKISPPPGIYTVPENSWAAVEESANVRIGIHHLFLTAIDEVTSLELPKVGEMRYQGEACVRLTDSRGHVHRVWTPVTGKVTSVNQQLLDDPTQLMRDPYGSGWVLSVAATDLVSDLKNLVSVST